MKGVFLGQRSEVGRRQRLVNDLLVSIHSIVSTLLKGCESGAPIILRSATTLLIAEMLSRIGCEETFKFGNHVSEMTDRSDFREPWYIPTCSAFSQLRFILDWLSGSGNGSSWPAICGVGPLDV